MSALRKILVVDDDPVVGKSFSRVLNNKGYAVITASSGEDALEKLRHQNYDAVFTDIKMPGMSGMEVAKYLKENQPWMPVVIVTGYGSKENLAQARELEVNDFICKPLTPEMIEESAKKATTPALKVEKVVSANEAVVVEKPSWLKNVALFLSAPFIGLAYVLAMPFVAVALLSYFGVKALLKTQTGRLIAAPFIGLAAILTLPIVGLVALPYFGMKAAFAQKE